MSKKFTDEEKNTIIEQQDFLFYYMHRVMVETVSLEKPENLNYSYYDLSEMLIENTDIFQKFSTNNLLLLLSKHSFPIKEEKQEAIKYIKTLLIERYKTGERLLGSSDIEIDFYGAHSQIFSSIKDLVKDNSELWNDIKNRIMEEYNNQKNNPVFSEIFELLSSYMSVDNLCQCIQNGIFDTPEKINLLHALAKKNPELIKKMDFNVFRDDLLKLGLPFVEHIASYPNLSYKFVKISENNPDLINAIANILDIKGGEIPPQKYESIEILALYLSKRCFSLKGVSFNLEDLENCAIRKWGLFGGNHNLIECEYGENYEERYRDECDSRFTSEDKFEVKKDILFNKYFSISMSDAKELINMYGSNIDKVRSLSKNGNALDFFDNVKRILDIQDIEELERLYNNPIYEIKPSMLLKMKEDIQELFAITYSNNLFDTKSHINLLQATEGKQVIYDGHPIDIIPMSGSFNFLVHSSDTGFKGEKKILDNDFKKTWENIPDPSTHLVSTSYINQDNLGSAPVKGNGVLYAFTEVPTERMKLLGNTDINSHVRTSYYSATNNNYVPANDISYETRRVYNEVAIERKDLKPDYIIVFDDTSETVIENSYKAALDWQIPIIYIDKEKIVNQQIENIDTLIELYEATNSQEYLKEVFTAYETNMSGWLLNKDLNYDKETYTDGIDNFRFKEQFAKIREKIMSVANKALNNPPNREFAVSIIESLLHEKELYDKANNMTTPISKTEMSLDAELLISNAIIGQQELLDDAQKKGYVHNAEEIKEAAKIDPEYRITNVFEIAQAIVAAEKEKNNESIDR